MLRNLGQVKDLPGGGLTILSSPNMSSFNIPRRLKIKPVPLWEKADHIWLVEALHHDGQGEQVLDGKGQALAGGSALALRHCIADLSVSMRF